MSHETINGMEYLTLKGMQTGALESIECVNIIRQWLPIKGSKAIGSALTMDEWFERMALHCIAFFKFHPQPGRYATTGPEPSGLLWRELCVAMSEVRSHYGLNDVDGDNRIPHSDVRGGQVLKPIDGSLLDRIEQAANGLLAIEEGPQINERKEAIFQMRHKTSKTWKTLSFEFDKVQTDGEALRKEIERYAREGKRTLPDRREKR